MIALSIYSPFSVWHTIRETMISIIPKLTMPGILFAVPKRRTTHSRRRIRMAPKWMKPMKNIVTCPVCNEPKLMHHICKTCLRRSF